MLNMTFIKRIKKNETGFTFIELLVATTMSLVVLGLIAHVFRSQQKEFATQTGLNTMQANGRAATEFIARSVQNAGFNVHRGTRFLAASDHYLTAVYDSNNDNVIQNDEVITYTIANVWDGTVNDTFGFVSYFDVDGNGSISSTENPGITVETTVSGPPFNLYKVIPDAAGTGIERNLIARDIDNMSIRYYDRNGRLLPIMNDTDNDGIGDTAFDADDDLVPDSGNWTFQFPKAELNDIRKVEIFILARSHNPSPRNTTSSGNYLQGSLAAVASGSTAYSDNFNREDFTAHMAPRNLVMAPWGSVEMVASPTTVSCPTSSTVTATLLDQNGDPVSGSTINFTATGGATVTLGSPSPTSDANGEGSTSVSYDYSEPYLASTVSGSALIDDGSGNLNPIYNAASVGFSYGAQGGFADPFDGTQTLAWDPLVPAGDNFEIDVEEFRSENITPGSPVGTLNGCASWADYIVQTNVTISATPTDDYFGGIILRNQDEDDYYYVRIYRTTTGPIADRDKVIVGRRVLGSKNDLNNLTISGGFVPGTTYTLKAQIQGDEIKVKLWAPLDPSDPAADEPAWEPTLTTTDTTFTSGRFGLEATDQDYRFDNVSVENPEGA